MGGQRCHPATCLRILQVAELNVQAVALNPQLADSIHHVADSRHTQLVVLYTQLAFYAYLHICVGL